MNRGKCLWITVLCVLTLSATVAAQDDAVLRVPVTMQPHAITAGTEEFAPAIPGFGYLNVAGAPRLPSRIVAVAVPPGAEILGIAAIPGAPVVTENVAVPPATPPRPISETSSALYEAELRNAEVTRRAVYSSDTPYPAAMAEFVRRAAYHRYELVDIRVTPYQYEPVSKRLSYYPDLALEVRYRRHPATVTGVTSPRIEADAAEFIVNLDEARSWYPATRVTRGLHDFVIITTTALEPTVVDLVAWETAKGRTPYVVTVDWIAANYTGADLAQKMRNFLLDKYPSAQWGIEDVLFAGHHSDVPMRQVWQDAGYGRPLTDFYFAELSLPDNQSWDSNSNGRYGEDSDNVDFYSEINVGRIPWSEFSTVQHICQKSVAYEMNDDAAYKKNILLLGAFFWDDTDNAVLMEAKVDQPWMSDWTMTRLYEQNSGAYSTYPCDYPLVRSNVQNVWPNGTYAFVNWAGHGSYYGCYIMGAGAPSFVESSDCSLLDDEYPAIIFADACSNSDTDYVNIGAAMLKRGAVGFVGATKVAYGSGGWSQPSDGSSQSLDYYFTTSVTSGEYTQGAGHQRALREVYQMNGFYYEMYEIGEWNLWGNPDLGMNAVLTSDGAVLLDRTEYAPDTEALITVRDLDLDLSAIMPDDVDVTVSASGGDQETVTLSETGFSTGFFEGTVSFSDAAPVNGDGVLQVTHGETVTVTYLDEDDGHGGVNVEKTAEAAIDALAPMITDVQVTRVTDTSFTVQWETDEDADSRVVYGEGVPSEEAGDELLTTTHAVLVDGLAPCTMYVFHVESTDLAGNDAIDDNGGTFYSQPTWERVMVFTEDLSADPGWTISGGAWAWGQPTGQGGEHGSPDPTSGHTGQNVYGYNLNGDYVNYMPQYSLTTPAIDCSEGQAVQLSFWRWLG
ncbi:hypothetical protein JW905_12200, partial [bacterium]|nr:hypothetical protein [candidate division CSSED10-310 bacterium]